MFEKLLSLVPYNPGILHSLSFYGRRMREEASIRRLGTVFLVLAFVVQSIAVINPPVSAAQCSTNDMLDCGFKNAKEAEDKCNDTKHNRGYKGFLHYYGIDCDAFKSAQSTEIETNGQSYYSFGRDTTAGSHNVQISNKLTVYWRDLNTWASGAHKCKESDNKGAKDCWSVLRIEDQDSNTWYVLYDCGNLVSAGEPHHNQLRKQTSEDTIDDFDFPTTTTTSNSGPVQGNPGVSNPDNTPPIGPPQDVVNTTTNTVSTPPQLVYPCKFNPNIGDSSPDCPKPCDANSSIPATSEQCFHPCQYNGTISDTDKACKPCDQSKNASDAAACVSIHKTASNITQNIADANDSTAQAGDVITYTLYAQNTGKAVIEDFTFQEDLSDVLDYADVVDPHGGTVANNSVIAWPKRDLAVGSSASVQATVKVKNPIPQTPAATNNLGGFDMIMTNVYGNSVNIKLPASTTKAVEMAAAKLPNTGPGTTLAIAAAVVVLAGYFYSRASLLAKETDLAIKEQAQ